MPDIFLYAGEATPAEIRLSDPTVLRAAPGGALTVAVADTLTLAEFVNALLPWLCLDQFELLTVTELSTVAPTLVVAHFDDLLLTDAASVAPTLVIACDELLTITEFSAVLLATLNLDAADTLLLDDTGLAALHLTPFTFSTLTLEDSAQASLRLHLDAFDTLTLHDAGGVTFGALLTIDVADTLTLADVPIPSLTLNFAVSDAILLTEAWTLVLALPAGSARSGKVDAPGSIARVTTIC